MKKQLIQLLEWLGFHTYAQMIKHRKVSIIFEYVNGALGSCKSESGRWGEHIIKLRPDLPSEIFKVVLLHETAHLIEHITNGSNREPNNWCISDLPINYAIADYNALLSMCPNFNSSAMDSDAVTPLLALLAHKTISVRKKTSKKAYRGHNTEWYCIYTELLYDAAWQEYIDVDTLTDELLNFKYWPYDLAIVANILQLPFTAVNVYDINDCVVSDFLTDLY